MSVHATRNIISTKMSVMEQETSASRAEGRGRRSRRGVTVGSARVRVGAVVAVAVAVGIVVWLLVGGSNNGTTPKGKRSVAAVSEQGLRTLAATFRSPIYWTGPRAGTKYELTQT